jgi:uncharacterized protein YqjF (DUF2071 family)
MRVERNGGSIRYRSERLAGPAAGSDIEVQIGAPIAEPNELELFLTARFRLYARRQGRLLHAAIEHSPWPLQRGYVVRLAQSIVQAAGLPQPEGNALVHFSSRVDVLTGAVEAA